MQYLSLLVALGALTSFIGYRHLPRPIYRLALLVTVVAAGVRFDSLLGPGAWFIAPMAVMGVITLMALRDEYQEGRFTGLELMWEKARQLWRAGAA